MINKNKIEFFFFNFFAKLFQKIGLEKTRRFAKRIGILIYHFIPIRKKTVVINIQKAFPQKSISEIRSIAKQTYQNITITFFELMWMQKLQSESFKEQVDCYNWNLFQEKLESGKGLILLTGHLGNWELILASITSHVSIKCNILVKFQRNPYLTEWLEKTRKRRNIEIIPTGAAAIAVNSIINGEVVLIVGDQRGPKEGKRFLFFNNPTSFYQGAATFFLKTNCNVLFCVMQRQPNFKYQLIFEELDLSNLPDDYDAKVYEITQRYISLLEKYVREYPEQYFWMHKLWKY